MRYLCALIGERIQSGRLHLPSARSAAECTFESNECGVPILGWTTAKWPSPVRESENHVPWIWFDYHSGLFLNLVFNILPGPYPKAKKNYLILSACCCGPWQVTSNPHKCLFNLRCEKESAKRRVKLIQQLEEGIAWQNVNKMCYKM